MALCTMCSELNLEFEQGFGVEIGIYREILAKSKSLGPGQNGCGGCKFFCAAIRKAISNRNEQKRDKTYYLAQVIITGELKGSLYLRLSRDSDVWYSDTLENVSLDKEEPSSGAFAWRGLLT